MNNVKRVFVTLTLAIFLTGCSVELQDYEPNQEAFDLKTYFTGNIVARGILQDHTNKVTRRFCVDIIGTWQEDEGVLAETFYFDDGEVSYRNWQLSKKANNRYEGTAEDVVGVAVGRSQGFAFQMQYELLLEVDNKQYQVQMDDWMYKLDNHRVMNKTSISKFGVEVANVTLFFDKGLTINRCRENE